MLLINYYFVNHFELNETILKANGRGSATKVTNTDAGLLMVKKRMGRALITTI